MHLLCICPSEPGPLMSHQLLSSRKFCYCQLDVTTEMALCPCRTPMCYPGNVSVLVGFLTFQLSTFICVLGAPLVAQMVKNPPAMQETQVRSLGSKNPLEMGVATHSSIPGLEYSMDRGAWATYSPWGHKESDTTEQVTLTFTSNTIPLESARICHLSIDLLNQFCYTL